MSNRKHDYYDKNYATASNRHINRFKMAHSIGVAEYMRERALDYDLDPDSMYVVGLLHDIGYLGGREGHEKRGAYLLDDLDMDIDATLAIKNHGENLRELHDREDADDAPEITPLLVLLVEADMSVDARGFRVGFEGRLADIARRYGEDHIAYKTVQDNIRFIKEYQKEIGIASRTMRMPQQSCEQDAHSQKRRGKPTALYHKDKQGEKDR